MALYKVFVCCAGVVFTIFLSGCLTDSGGESGTDIDFVQSLDSFVCNPFENQSNVYERTQGIHGTLYYRGADQLGDPWYYTSDYINRGYVVDDVDIFLNQLHIPTRPFDRGFTTRSGQTLLSVEGDTLYEWFGLRFQTNVHLAHDQPGGLYQFAILSDDGSHLKVDFGNGFETYIDNDFHHSTKMACSIEPVLLQPGQKLPVELDYYQGPRYHISLVILMRPWPGTAEAVDPLCGEEGNSLFFDSTKDPIVANQGYLDLMSRGWEQLTPDNYSLREPYTSNPCNAEAPIISGVEIVDVQNDSVSLSWRTNISSTSQVFFRRQGEVDYLSTTLDTNLVQNHTMSIEGLSSNTVYEILVESASTSGRSSRGEPPIAVRTRR